MERGADAGQALERRGTGELPDLPDGSATGSASAGPARRETIDYTLSNAVATKSGRVSRDGSGSGPRHPPAGCRGRRTRRAPAPDRGEQLAVRVVGTVRRFPGVDGQAVVGDGEALAAASTSQRPGAGRVNEVGCGCVTRPRRELERAARREAVPRARDRVAAGARGRGAETPLRTARCSRSASPPRWRSCSRSPGSCSPCSATSATSAASCSTSRRRAPRRPAAAGRPAARARGRAAGLVAGALAGLVLGAVVTDLVGLTRARPLLSRSSCSTLDGSSSSARRRLYARRRRRSFCSPQGAHSGARARPGGAGE